MGTQKIFESLKNNQNIVVSCRAEGCNKLKQQICQESHKTFNKVFLISFSKISPDQIKKFNEEKGEHCYYFLDCFPSKLVSETKGYMHIASPTSLIELSAKINRLLRKERIDMIFLDNISSMLIYNDDVKVMQFLHSLMNKLRGTKTKAVYMNTTGKGKHLLPDIAMFADDIIRI